jgi:drug/metabolite transporter (DMT)-like permease
VRTGRERALGIACAVVALVLWTWYAIANAEFLKARPELRASAWSTAVGAGTIVLVIVALPVVLLTGLGAPAIETLRMGGTLMLWRFIGASIVLGVLVSWGGTLLWNCASERPPVALAGQLIVLETVVGMIYIFTALRRVPSVEAVVGVVVLVAGVLLGIRRTRPSSVERDVAVHRRQERARE